MEHGDVIIVGGAYYTLYNYYNFYSIIVSYMKTILSGLFCIAAFSFVQADTITMDCDTLFTNDGKIYFVKYYGTLNQKVEYALCDDITGQRYSLPVDKVSRIGENKSTKREVKHERDELETLARNAYIYALAGLVLMGVLGVFGLIFMIIGAVKGERALRRLKKIGTHPEKNKIKRQAKNAVVLTIASIIGMIALYLFILLLLAI